MLSECVQRESCLTAPPPETLIFSCSSLPRASVVLLLPSFRRHPAAMSLQALQNHSPCLNRICSRLVIRLKNIPPYPLTGVFPWALSPAQYSIEGLPGVVSSSSIITPTTIRHVYHHLSTPHTPNEFILRWWYPTQSLLPPEICQVRYRSAFCFLVLGVGVHMELALAQQDSCAEGFREPATSR